MARARLTAIVAAVLGLGALAMADGLIVPTDPAVRVRGQWAVKYHRVTISVRDQVADVHVDQAFENLSGREMEVEYLFPVPPGAAIDSMTLLADGKELPGQLLGAEEARKIYEDIVRRKKDPALMEYVGYGLYKTRVFPLPPGAQRRVQVHYTTLCRNDAGLVTVHYPLNTEKFSARAIDEVRVTVDIHADAPIGPVYSPTHDLAVDRPSPRHVRATYAVEKAIPNTDLQVVYQPTGQAVGATVIAHEPKADEPGYFLLLVSPAGTGQAAPRAIPKDVVLVLDRSGSMSGEKIDQARQAAKWIVGNLGPEDRFNVVSFSDTIERMFSEALVPADAEHKARAEQLVRRIGASGGTNIHDALVFALQQLDGGLQPGSGGGEGRPQYVIFLTDGQPTTGVTDEAKIVAAVGEANTRGARLFCVGVGYDANVRLIDRLGLENDGSVAYVKPNESLEGPVSRLYAKIQNPVLTDVALDFGGAEVFDQYPREPGDLFEGDQLVVVGRYREVGSGTLTLRGRQGDERVEFRYDIALPRRSADSGNAYVEKLWAMRRVGYLMDQIALHGEDKELVDALVKLSRDYGILTPYTAFLADEGTDLADREAVHRRARQELRGAMTASGSGEAAQRSGAVRSYFRESSKAAPPPVAATDAGGRYVDGHVLQGNTSRQAYEAGEVERVANVRQVGQTTLYRRDNQWYTPDLAEQPAQPTDARTLRQFSGEYFALAAANSPEQNQLFAAQRPGEELLVRLRGQIYRILPAE